TRFGAKGCGSPNGYNYSQDYSGCWRFLAAAGISWHSSRLTPFLAPCLPLLPGAARSRQFLPGTDEGLVRPTGFEPVACGSGGRRSSAITIEVISTYGGALRRLQRRLQRARGP